MESEDNSEETLGLLRRWDIPPKPPGNIIHAGLVGQCSRPIRKQLTESDVNGGDLMIALSLVKKNFLPLLEESEVPKWIEGNRVMLYGPDGKIHEMTGWRKFVRDYELKEICDFITMWMFRHAKTHEICFAIDRTRLSLQKQLSKRISMAVFED